MASRQLNLGRLQAVAESFSQPEYSIKIVSPHDKKDVFEASRLLEEVWTVGEPVSVALLSDPDLQRRGIRARYQKFCLDCCQLASEYSLLLAAVSRESGKMIALVLAMPCTSEVYSRLTSGQDDLLAPLFDILARLDPHVEDAIDKLDSRSRASMKLLDMFGCAVSRQYEGRHVTHSLRDVTIRIGHELGFTHGVGKLSSPWQRAIEGWGWTYLGEVSYHEYEWKGRRPFTMIERPAAIQLAWFDVAKQNEKIQRLVDEKRSHSRL